jgi:YVTN family beta-propeller protein
MHTAQSNHLQTLVCQVAARHTADHPPTHRSAYEGGSDVSTRIRITLALLTALVALAATTIATAKRSVASRRSATAHPTLPQYHARGVRRGAVLSAFAGPFGFGSSLVGSAPVGIGPSSVAVNPQTRTIYVANGNNINGDPVGGDTVSVIDARHCHARDVSRCNGPWPTITVGNLPSGIAIDRRTDTVYVASSEDNTVSVFNGATCNAIDSSGCGQQPVAVPVGLGPLQVFADDANNTVYVANSDDASGASTTVSMIDSASCNATHLARCPATAPPTVDVGAAPFAVTASLATHTVYVTTVGALNGWSVFDANTCNATVQSGCGSIGYLTGDPAGPNGAEVDPANDTLYTANFDNTMSAFDLRHCSAGNLTGCAAETPGTVTPFPDPGFGEHDLWVAVDTANHTVYAVYQKDDALLAIDTRACNGRHPAACATLSPSEIHTGADPEMVSLDPNTQTLYTANQVDNDVSVIDASRCNAQTTVGCRHPAPTFRSQSEPLAADSATHTLYATSGTSSIAMIDTNSCNARSLEGCLATAATAAVGDFPVAAAVDRRTHTVYVANKGSSATGTVSVIDERACNAQASSGCTHIQTLHVPGGNSREVAVNPATDTVYVATITSSGPDLISVFNGATCNATATVGCGQTPATLAVGDSGSGQSALSIAVNRATNTIYATNLASNTGTANDDSVFVFTGATCDASNTTGCDQAPATVTIAPGSFAANPDGIAVDERTNTIYTANLADGEHAGSVSVIAGATCNGHDTSGCTQTPTTVPAGFGSVDLAIDRKTHKVYVTNVQDTSVSVIDGTTCNGSDTTSCSHDQTKLAVGNYPGAIVVDHEAGTVYVSNGDGTMSVLPLS